MVKIDHAVDLIKKGGVIIFPTETLYGIGGNSLDKRAVKKIFEIKKRPLSKVLPVIIGNISQIDFLVESFEYVPMDLILDHFWPGPLSILFPGKKDLPKGILSGKGYVCVRLTSHPIARKLCVKSGFPLFATSANRSGMPSPKSFEEIDADVLGMVDMALNLGPRPSGVNPSTIVKFVEKNIVEILRHGEISCEDLRRVGLYVK